jgi:hypothetical protein
VFYDTSAANADILQNNNTQPFRYGFTFPVPYSLTDPLRGLPQIPLTVNLVDPIFVGLPELSYPVQELRTSYLHHFNLNIQRQVFRDLAVQLAYVGKLGHKLKLGLLSNVNVPVFGPGATLGNLNARRPIQGYGNISTHTSQANSNYHALQVEVNKRFSGGFSLQGAYTFGRSIDNTSGIAGSTVPNVFNLRSQYGLSDFHSKHILSCSWIWDLPGLRGQPALLRAIAGGWQTNGLVSASSGSPINIVIGADIALNGSASQRPNVIGDPELPGDRPRSEKILAWFNRAAFAEPAAGAYGNLGRNAVLGPPSVSTNAGLFKNFDLPGREGLRLQFRSEFFNLFNSVNLNAPNTTLRAGQNFGRITAAGPARVIQLALKVTF